MNLLIIFTIVAFLLVIAVGYLIRAVLILNRRTNMLDQVEAHQWSYINQDQNRLQELSLGLETLTRRLDHAIHQKPIRLQDVEKRMDMMQAQTAENFCAINDSIDSHHSTLQRLCEHVEQLEVKVQNLKDKP